MMEKIKYLVIMSVIAFGLAYGLWSCGQCDDCGDPFSSVNYGIVNDLDSSVNLIFKGNNDSLSIFLSPGGTSELWKGGTTVGIGWEPFRGSHSFPYNSQSFDVDTISIRQNDSTLVVFSYFNRRESFDVAIKNIFNDASYDITEQWDYYYSIDSLKIK